MHSRATSASPPRPALVPVRTAQPAAPLVLLSNRGPYARGEVRGVSQWVRTVGGLVSALDPVVRERGGIWVAAADSERAEVPPPDVAGYELAPVSVRKDAYERYYNCVANGVLWPLFHSMPSRVRTRDVPWDIYRAVNLDFAARADAAAGPRATFWVQDFQLTLVPAALRARRPGARIGWFCHIPFPPPELFEMLPWRVELLEGLLGADLLGFQTQRDARNFLAAVAELTAHPVDAVRGTVSLATREVRVRAFPIGIDVDAVQQISADPDVRAQRERLRGEFGNVRVLLAVDRLDYTKGLPERLHAYGLLLERHQEFQQRVSLVQVAVPSRTEVEQYALLKREVDELVGQINGRFAKPGWVPVQYLYRGLSLYELVALYGMADVGVVTPLRDGMNLVAHEYVAARIDHEGVLVLSEFAGAATILDGALRVNPYDPTGTAEALASALTMPREEQVERMRALRNAVRKHRVSYWQAAFLSALEGHAPRAPENTGVFPRPR